ncbi:MULTISPECIES: VF530 family DNA-binding protein [Deinococcus]|uniref:VF530 family DNA-binding protein n=1 Tax=Deinococcus rufus TaxID=2136097 RepID=A0ABV7Z5P8_9DEIO|nr:VF530 family DNA-binding protein [Deinococcus sp. AB2017081]WQE96438.1 VF530 family DNA-binding protein [Deinococcus sp. AB2017081]
MGDGERRSGMEGVPVSAVQALSRDPLHGVTLQHLVEKLHAEYGWEELARRIPVRCFQSDPSVTSSLKFLRKTPWAREQVEEEFRRLTRREEGNPLTLALKRGDTAEFTRLLASGTMSQARVHGALGWALRHLPADDERLAGVLRPLLEGVEDVNHWPDHAPLPLLSLAIDRDADPAFVRDLLRRGADADDARFWPPLLHTTDVEGQAYRGKRRAPRTDVLDALLAAGADASRADARGNTALSIAHAYGLRAFVNKLNPPNTPPPSPSDL